MNIKKFFDASILATRNTAFSRFLNKVINNCQIDKHAQIDKSLILTHSGAATVIGRNVKIGKNVRIFHNVTIGTLKLYSDEYPKIEDNVTIYPGCVIIGGITIGEGSIIGAHSFINKDIPRNSVVYNKVTLTIAENPSLDQ